MSKIIEYAKRVILIWKMGYVWISKLIENGYIFLTQNPRKRVNLYTYNHTWVPTYHLIDSRGLGIESRRVIPRHFGSWRVFPFIDPVVPEIIILTPSHRYSIGSAIVTILYIILNQWRPDIFAFSC